MEFRGNLNSAPPSPAAHAGWTLCAWLSWNLFACPQTSPLSICIGPSALTLLGGRPVLVLRGPDVTDRGSLLPPHARPDSIPAALSLLVPASESLQTHSGDHWAREPSSRLCLGTRVSLGPLLRASCPPSLLQRQRTSPVSSERTVIGVSPRASKTWVCLVYKAHTKDF